MQTTTPIHPIKTRFSFSWDKYVWIGIDVGKKGATGFISDLGDVKVLFFQDPSLVPLLKYIVASPVESFALLEEAVNMPGQQGFHFGLNYGRWLERLELLNIPFETLNPSAWKAQMGITRKKATVKAIPGETKEGKAKRVRSRNANHKQMLKQIANEKAARLFPTVREELLLNKTADKAEALLLAQLCRERRSYWLLTATHEERQKFYDSVNIQKHSGVSTTFRPSCLD